MTSALARTHQPKSDEANANRSTQINPPISKQRTNGRNKVGNSCPEAILDDAAD